MRKIYISLLSIVLVLVASVSTAQKAPNGDIYLHMLTSGTPAATKFLGDQLNPTGTWHIQFELGQTSWYQSDAGIGSDYTDLSTWTWRTANWFEDGSGSNKRVRSDFGNFRFTQAGYWYFAGRSKGESFDPFHYANSIDWSNATTLEPIYYFQVDVINGVGSALAQQNSSNPSTSIDLSWIKNEQGHNVMIVRKNIYESWTEPTQGQTYIGGNTIGSGVVVYNSSGTSYTNIDLASSTDYDYKFYSVNNNYYSEGIYNAVVSTYTAFAIGDGTTGNPFRVANADALNCVRHYTTTMSMTDGNFIQTADIDLGGVYAAGEGWMPIDELRGSYNGQEHTINNLTINRPTNGYVGLFSVVSTGIISNLGLINVNIIGYVYAGSFAASMSVGNTPTTIQMDKCYATGAVSIVSGGLGSYVGGLVGHLAAPINRCYSTCTVNNATPTSPQFVGGLVGAFDGSSVMTNCYATGAVTAADNGYTQYIGGLIGWANGDVSIQKSFATGFLTYGNSIYTSTGGLVGRYEFNANSSDSFFDMETTGQPASMLFDHGKTTAEMKTVGTFLATGWDFSPSGVWAINGTTNNGYPYLRYQGATPANIWNGATSTDWNEPENWNENVVPASDKTVIIPAVTNYPVIGTAAVVTNLTIETDGLLTVDYSGTLTVSGTLTNMAGTGGLIVKANPSGYGSLIENNGVDATVESFLSANAWHFISSPVSGLTSSLFETKYLQQHTETGGFVDVPALDLSLAPARGFALWSETAKGYGGSIVSYAGPLNTGAMPAINVTRAAAGEDRGWNLIGNPYASVLDWDLVGKTNVNTAIYIENNSGWAIYNSGVGVPESTSSKYIAPAQGFFVQVTDGQSSGAVSIANADRVHTATTFYKNSGISDLIRLQVSGNSFTDEAVVRFALDATSEFDGNYDAHKFFSEVSGNAQVYTLGSTPLAINALQSETGSVPLGIRSDSAGTYTLTATDLRNISYAILEDTKTGILTDLITNAYTFNFEPGENEIRFILHFVSFTSVKEPQKSLSAVYSNHKAVVINITDQARGDIYIYNLAGQLIATKLEAQGKTEIGLPVSGNYIVKVISKDNSLVRKVFVK
ncbi:MAG: T9SS type A sorting domain-containing protein [Bacteroidales bacterium]|nr:T9SS type A sorting domain-containing protein [Bacteroidales bacterium]